MNYFKKPTSKNRSIILLIVCFTLLANAGTAQRCDTTFTDTGGNGIYTNNENYTILLCPNAPDTQVMELTFFSFDVHCSDTMEIFNGLDTLAPSLGKYCGIGASSSPGILMANGSSGCLIIQFVSDNNLVGSGWEAAVTCKNNPSERLLNADIEDKNVSIKATTIKANHAIAGNSVVTLRACEVLLSDGFDVKKEVSFLAQTDLNQCKNNLSSASNAVQTTRYEERIMMESISLNSEITKNSLKVYPNPFTHQTTIEYEVGATSKVHIAIVDITGRTVQVLENSIQENSTYTINWSSVDLTNNIYFLRTQIDGEIIVKKLYFVD